MPAPTTTPATTPATTSTRPGWRQIVRDLPGRGPVLVLVGPAI